MKGFFITVFCLVSMQLLSQKVIEPERDELKIQQLYTVTIPNALQDLKVLVSEKGETCLAYWNFYTKSTVIQTYDSVGRSAVNLAVKSRNFHFIDSFETDSSFVIFSTIYPTQGIAGQMRIFEVGKNDPSIEILKGYSIDKPQSGGVSYSEFIHKERLWRIHMNKKSEKIVVEFIDKDGAVSSVSMVGKHKSLIKQLIRSPLPKKISSELKSGLVRNKIHVEDSGLIISANDLVVRLDLETKSIEIDTLKSYSGANSISTFVEGYWINISKISYTILIDVYDANFSKVASKVFGSTILFKEIPGFYELHTGKTIKPLSFYQGGNFGFVARKHDETVKVVIGTFIPEIITSGGGYLRGGGVAPSQSIATGQLAHAQVIALSFDRDWEVESITQYPNSFELEAEILRAQRVDVPTILGFSSEKIYDDYYIHTGNNSVAHLYIADKKTISVFSATFTKLLTPQP